MKVPTNDPRNAARVLADRVDELSGVVAALAAHVAHITGTEFTAHDFRLVQTAAQKMALPPIGASPKSDPKLFAAESAKALWKMVQGLRASRSTQA
jgi:hypothetical protein